jgi:phosphatidylinositol alpha-1,6-mannosyltransferase
MPPSVLVLQHGAPGGIGRFELLLQRALELGGSSADAVGVISRRRPQRRFVEAAQPSQAKFVVVGNPLLYALRSAWKVVVAHPDVIVYTHINLARLQLVFRWLRPGARTVLVTYGIEIWQPLSWARRFALRRCSQIVTLTRFVANTLEAAHGQRHAPIAVVPPGLSDEWTAAVVPRREPTSDAIVLTVCRLSGTEREKGVDRIVEAFPQILRRVPLAQLRIVGDGSDRPRLERLSASLGVEHRVHFLGAVDDAALKELYATSDIFALPSVQEGFGLVYLEAMAHGLPCVVAADTAGAEVVEADVTGLGVRPGDVDQLADAIASLLNDRERWVRMNRAASACFQERYREAAFGRRLRGVVLGVD